MSNAERTTSWQQIQSGVEGTERLIVRKERNLVMVKAGQVLEYVVRYMAKYACLVEGDLSDVIDQLHEGRWTNKATKGNYHIIRMLGNEAVHEGDDTTYDANQAYQFLTQEVYMLANEFSGERSSTRAPQTGRAASPGRTSRCQGSSSRSGARSPQSGNRRPTQSGGRRQGDPRKKKRRWVSPVSYIWGLLIPILIVVLLTVVIRIMVLSGDKDEGGLTATPTVTTAAAESAPILLPEPEMVPEIGPPVAIYRIKGSSVDIHTGPSTGSRIIVQLTNGAEVDYVKCYNNNWDMISYDGQEAYVPNRLLEKVEPVAETEAPATSGSGQNN